MPFKIYPPIGIARLGNAEAFFVGPESPGSAGIEIKADGTEVPVLEYKVGSDQIKRQAARFRIFEFPADGGEPKLAEFPPGTTIEWTVHLVNKKAAVQRDLSPPDEPQRPVLDPALANRLIDSGEKTVTGAEAGPVALNGGSFEGQPVSLGEIRTDRNQSLLVLGGRGVSASPSNQPITNFYSNTRWHDDTSDGSIRARITLPDDSVHNATSAWVVVAPPDFAPQIDCVVPLYEILQQVGIDNHGFQPPATISFSRDVFPILFRMRRLQWVNELTLWTKIPEDWPALADPSAGPAQQQRGNVAAEVRSIENALSDFILTNRQNAILDKWVDGDFDGTWNGIPAPEPISPAAMTRAALDATAGQGFYPGIEGGIIVRDPTLYTTPFDFRFDAAQIQPGDITALMALPWQADFLACQINWWPSNRPDDVFPSVASTERKGWVRGVDGYKSMIRNAKRLGFITAQKDPAGKIVFAESQRADDADFE